MAEMGQTGERKNWNREDSGGVSGDGTERVKAELGRRVVYASQ